MRILQVTASAERRGAEVFAHQLGRSLTLRGHQVTTVSLQVVDPDTDLPFESLGGRFGPSALGSLARTARRHDATIAHGGSALAPTMIASALARRPFVYRNIGDPSFWGDVRLANVRIGVPLRRADMVMALYPGAERYLREHYRLDGRRVTVSSNAVESAGFLRRTENERRAARSALDLQEDRVVVGYLGALSTEKRPEWALSVAESLPEAVVVIAGAGPLAPPLHERAARLGVDRVRLVGRTSDPAAFLRALDVLVIPSRTEGVPGVLLEAALTGVPVVATDVGGVGDVVRELSCGVVVAPTDEAALVDAVRRVAEDPTGHLAERTVVERHHDIEHVADVWIRVLRSIASSAA